MSNIKEYNYNDKFQVHEDVFLKRIENLINKYSNKIIFDKRNYPEIIKYLEENYSVYNMDSKEIKKYQFYEDIDIYFKSAEKAFRNELNNMYIKYNLDIKKLKISRFVLDTKSDRNNKIFLHLKEKNKINYNKNHFLYVYVFIDNITGLIKSRSIELENELYIYRGINEFDYKYITNDLITFLLAIDYPNLKKLTYIKSKPSQKDLHLYKRDCD
ncbi:hypothetical protein [Tissierella praeacuta]|uniref:hypothetical protein n=1 Tax=Tissierella praeacuta TaxID=43131 RepID=UPI0033409CB4